jgi:hypothetical protein
LVREDLKLHEPTIDPHISAYTGEEPLNATRAGIVRVGKVLCGGQNNLGLQHSTAPQKLLQPDEAVVHPLTVFVT